MKQFKLTLYILFILGFCSASLSQTQDSSRYSVQRLNINSKRSDFSPFLYDKKLYFSSGREHSFGIIYSGIETNRELIDVFYADQTDSVNFKKPDFLSKINSKYNDGPVCISKDGKQLFISRTDLKRSNGKNKKPLSIFISKKENNAWSNPEPLSFCTGSFNYCHPAFSPDGKTLVFSSDIKEGAGGMDLYYSKFENGNWTIPRNLGAKINGPADEVFPFISQNEVLYFSTNRKNGYGGLDMYTFDLKDVKNADIQILESPINSAFDDFGIWMDSTENNGYFSSNRDTATGDDIFYLKNRYPDFEKCTPCKKETYCYTFFEESSILTQDTLGMVYEWSFGDGTKKRGLEVKHCFETPGDYSVQLNIIEKASGNLFYNELSYNFLIEEPKRLFIDCSDTVAVLKNFELDIKKSVIPNHTIKEVYWFFGDGNFAAGGSVKHTYTKEGNYIIKLGVVAVNDSTKKTESFCTQRTVLVKDSLWIDKQRKQVIPGFSKIDSLNYAFAADSLWQTKYKPYFNYTPTKIDSLNYMNELDNLWIAKHKHDFNFIPSNTDVLYNITESDSTNFRIYLGSSKKNIPITAKVFDELNNVKKYKEKDGYSYTSGNFKKLKNAIPDYEKAKAKGFKDAAVVGFQGDSIIAGQEKSLKGVITDANKMPVDNDLNSLHSRNILFDFDRAIINKSDYKYLDSVTNVLRKNKKFELIILAATDSVGSNSYNIKLAKKRAYAVRQYFIEKGISEERLDINTFGENMPAEYAHDKISVISNRRVEILLVKKL